MSLSLAFYDHLFIRMLNSVDNIPSIPPFYNFLTVGSFIVTETVVSRNATAAILAGTATKPSFLLWEKVYQKLTSVEEERWLLRALRAALVVLKSEKSEHLRYTAMHTFICANTY